MTMGIINARLIGGTASTETSNIAVQHICGWDTPLTDQQIADIVTATNL